MAVKVAINGFGSIGKRNCRNPKTERRSFKEIFVK